MHRRRSPRSDRGAVPATPRRDAARAKPAVEDSPDRSRTDAVLPAGGCRPDSQAQVPSRQAVRLGVASDGVRGPHMSPMAFLVLASKLFLWVMCSYGVLPIAVGSASVGN